MCITVIFNSASVDMSRIVDPHFFVISALACKLARGSVVRGWGQVEVGGRLLIVTLTLVSLKTGTRGLRKMGSFLNNFGCRVVLNCGASMTARPCSTTGVNCGLNIATHGRMGAFVGSGLNICNLAKLILADENNGVSLTFSR